MYIIFNSLNWFSPADIWSELGGETALSLRYSRAHSGIHAPVPPYQLSTSDQYTVRSRVLDTHGELYQSLMDKLIDTKLKHRWTNSSAVAVIHRQSLIITESGKENKSEYYSYL